MSLEDECWTAFDYKDHKEAVRLLPLVEDKNKIRIGRDGLLHLSSRNGWLDVTKDLITKYHCDPHERGFLDLTCLHWAADGNHVDVMRYLIDECHCDPMAVDRYGRTPLHFAARWGSSAAAEYLLSTGKCDPLAKDNEGRTPFTLAKEKGHTDTLSVFKKFGGIKSSHPIDSYVNVLLVGNPGAGKSTLNVTKDLITKYHCDPHERDGGGWTCLHWAARWNHVDVMRYLIDECHCDPMAIDGDGWTPLHYAARWGKSGAVEYLLSTGKCDPLAKDNMWNTPFSIAKKYGNTDILSVFKKFGGIKSSHPIDSYVNVLLVGNPGAGKSTLSHVIKDTATGSIVLGSFRNVGGVVACTAGIIPYKLQHRTLGNIILHDFAGHSEYYSSHSAVIENLLHGSGGVFLIVVNILEKEAVKQLYQWLTVVRNEAQKALNECHVIVIVSHVDEIFTNPFERRRRKEEIQEIIGRERCDSMFLDCRKLGGSGVDSFFNKLCSACESIRSTSGRNLSLYCHMMYGLLEERKENILTLSDVMSAGEDNDDYFIPDKREDVLDVLDSLHSI
uniref:Uncharacterized protein n=1 Tax=Amphimedon queenslandica TaxID=400682 RepID=A0A1X7UIL8_AMPQE